MLPPGSAASTKLPGPQEPPALRRLLGILRSSLVGYYDALVNGPCEELRDRGYALVGNCIGNTEEAFGLARELVDLRSAQDRASTLSLIGDFVIPPVDAQQTRDFQTLHFDFGLPLDPKLEQDVARYTALFIPHDVSTTSAFTRLVPLNELLAQRSWPERQELVLRLVDYGRTHGAWDDAGGYVEGSLARIVEAVAALPPVLPSVKTAPGFLCGMEFDCLRSELAFFDRHCLSLEAAQIEVRLEPGALLVFDNLALAHGRRGRRHPGELRQWVFGQGRLGVPGQRGLRERLLAMFDDPIGA